MRRAGWWSAAAMGAAAGFTGAFMLTYALGMAVLRRREPGEVS